MKNERRKHDYYDQNYVLMTATKNEFIYEKNTNEFLFLKNFSPRKSYFDVI